jgi:hypothetical protein
VTAIYSLIKRVDPEWRLVKGSIIAGFVLPEGVRDAY